MSTRLQHLGRLIDRGKPLNFTFNGRRLKGCEGDTLASALLANDRMLVGRSFKYHRPRGILARPGSRRRGRRARQGRRFS